MLLNAVNRSNFVKKHGFSVNCVFTWYSVFIFLHTDWTVDLGNHVNELRNEDPLLTVGFIPIGERRSPLLMLAASPSLYHIHIIEFLLDTSVDRQDTVFAGFHR